MRIGGGKPIMDDRIVIKGNRVGISAIINIDKFSGFEEMLENLVGKLSKGKRFYKNSTLVISTNLNSINEKNLVRLKEVLFNEI